MELAAFSGLEQWTFEIGVVLISMKHDDGEIVSVREQWMAEVHEMANDIWKRHETMECAVNELRSGLNAPLEVAAIIANVAMQRVRAKEQRRPSITDLGDSKIIPHDYLDNLLEEATANNEGKEAIMMHIQLRLQRHLPLPVSQTLAETLVNSVPGMEDEDEDGQDNAD